MKNFSILLLFLAFLFAGCQSNSKDFQLFFAMESIQIYKVSIEINSDKSYRIQQQNKFFDAHANKEQINNSEGKMKNKEFKELTDLINLSQLFELEDTYGFDKESNSIDPFKNLIYRLDYREGNESKHFLIHPNLTGNAYPENLSQLINFLNKFISTHSGK